MLSWVGKVFYYESTKPKDLLGQPFTLPNGLQLTVEYGDITTVSADAVVVGENDEFSGNGAVAKLLLERGGEEYREARELLKITAKEDGCSAIVYTCPGGGNLNFKHVFHAVVTDQKCKPRNWSQRLCSLFMNVAKEADTREMSCVATPLVGAGKAKGDQEVSLKALVHGFSMIHPTVLCRVILVDYDRKQAAYMAKKISHILAQKPKPLKEGEEPLSMSQGQIQVTPATQSASSGFWSSFLQSFASWGSPSGASASPGQMQPMLGASVGSHPTPLQQPLQQGVMNQQASEHQSHIQGSGKTPDPAHHFGDTERYGETTTQVRFSAEAMEEERRNRSDRSGRGNYPYVVSPAHVQYDDRATYVNPNTQGFQREDQREGTSRTHQAVGNEGWSANNDWDLVPRYGSPADPYQANSSRNSFQLGNERRRPRRNFGGMGGRPHEQNWTQQGGRETESGRGDQTKGDYSSQSYGRHNKTRTFPGRMAGRGKTAVAEDEICTSGQRKSKTHSDSRPEFRPAHTTDGGREEKATELKIPSTSVVGPEKSAKSESNVNTGEQKSEKRVMNTFAEPRAAPSSKMAPEKSTLAEKEVSTRGQRKRKTLTEPKASSTSDQDPEKSTKSESEVDTSGQNNMQRDLDTPTEPRAAPSSEKDQGKSTVTEVQVSTSGQRKSKTHSNSRPVFRPAPTTDGDREESPIESMVPFTADEGPEKSAKSEIGVDAYGQKTKERDTDILAEPRAAPSPEKDQRKSTIEEKDVSTSGQRKSKIPTESKGTPTSSTSPEKSAISDLEFDRSGQKNKRDTLTEPRAAQSPEKDQGKSTLPEKEVSTSGQRKSKTHRDSTSASTTASVSNEGPEASSTSESKDRITGQNEKEMNKEIPTDSSPAITPADDPPRPTNPEKVTTEMSHSRPKEHGESKAEDGEVQAKNVDSKDEINNQQADQDVLEDAGRPEEPEEEDKASCKKTEADSIIVGNMPPGVMTSTTQHWIRVSGYDDCGLIIIDYCIPMGKQGVDHPEPGSPYSGCVERAFLPDNQEGRRVLQLLQKAFDRRLTFQLVQTGPTGEWEVEFSDIPHKTSLKGGPEGGGYPDPGYLEHVQSVLRDKYGIE